MVVSTVRYLNEPNCMKVILAYLGGPADGLREEIEVDSPKAFRHRIKTTVDEDRLTKKNPANISVYVLQSVNNASTPEWIYEDIGRLTMSEYQQQKHSLEQS